MSKKTNFQNKHADLPSMAVSFFGIMSFVFVWNFDIRFYRLTNFA